LHKDKRVASPLRSSKGFGRFEGDEIIESSQRTKDLITKTNATTLINDCTAETKAVCNSLKVLRYRGEELQVHYE
jgi:hypothetical protein